ncbi:hypothetical protein Daus18300_008070 [Diaporthe australafricana]|uniref:Uncharacterized protein n=1 Tax=Diaporthe australafricana TaxID=127596 RepID=A0ABR3WK78_9PEZI
MFPEHNLSYAIVTMSRWAPEFGASGCYLKKTGAIVIPMIKAQRSQNFSKAAQYSLVVTPRCSLTKYMTKSSPEPMQEEFGDYYTGGYYTEGYYTGGYYTGG